MSSNSPDNMFGDDSHLNLLGNFTFRGGPQHKETPKQKETFK